ncbi:Indolepyruvate oxidoreductase subunit IorB II [hydrothermal vent metagenome]|uniref:Indolepyruvate oxidoreductase subunit IorB II n=1 Tax=hydrothermal vent metagenome TaxID=652676 RepID=A0A3B1BLL5_9ZZZZ
MISQMKRPITIIISALGGQGGGVLTSWLVNLAEQCDYFAQSTSVPGVAQRTGATIYYLEIFPKSSVVDKTIPPVMALMPTAGDVDLVVAAELMEAGRAVQRQFVTPDKTTLITSSHRVYAISEKMAMGDGIGDSETVMRAAHEAAKNFIAFDMEKLASEMSCVISSILFGAIAGSKSLPFSRENFEEAIKAEGKMVEVNLRGFDAGFLAAEKSKGESPPNEVSNITATMITGQANSPEAEALIKRINALPETAREFTYAGAQKLLDYQDLNYADEYLRLLEGFVAEDKAPFDITRDLARHLALWMAFDDTIKVADIKTRTERVEKYRAEVKAAEGQIVHMVEFMHPRIEEITGTMPRIMANMVKKSSLLTSFFKKFTGPRLLDTTKISSFLMLYFIASLKPIRRRTERFHQEFIHITGWLGRIRGIMTQDYDLAVEIIRCQRLIKGYGETHERGLNNFTRIMSAIDQGNVKAQRVAELKQAALADEEGKALDNELNKTRS